MVVCPKTGLPLAHSSSRNYNGMLKKKNPQEKKESSQEKQRLPQEKKKLPQGKNKSPQEKMKLPQESRHPFPASFHYISLGIFLLREKQYGPF